MMERCRGSPDVSRVREGRPVGRAGRCVRDVDTGHAWGERARASGRRCTAARAHCSSATGSLRPHGHRTTSSQSATGVVVGCWRSYRPRRPPSASSASRLAWLPYRRRGGGTARGMHTQQGCGCRRHSPDTLEPGDDREASGLLGRLTAAHRWSRCGLRRSPRPYQRRHSRSAH